MKKSAFKQFYLIVLLLLSLSAYSQNVRITGTVVDSNGEALPGVNIVVQGIARGVMADALGQFSIEAEPMDILVFSFVGYESKSVQVGNQKSINVTLNESVVAIGEVEIVAVGYGDVRRKDLTGSVAKANMSDILKTPVTSNVTQALGGRIAGVQVSSKDGGLGNNFSITIRGAGSLTQSTEPLYVIDGFPMESNNMGALNPNDIVSMDVLKDASATAIYGSRGSNGVVIITTKSGQAGRPHIEYNGNFSVSDILRKQELLNGYEFVLLQQELMNETDFASNYLMDGHTVEDYKTMPDYDWQGSVFTKAFTNNQYISLSGKQADLRYSLSGSYLDQEGVIINSNLNKYQGRISLEQGLAQNKLTLKIISNISRTVRNGADPTGGKTSVSSALMYSVWGYRPVSPSGIDLMEQLYDNAVEMTEDYRFNPVLSANNEYRRAISDNFNINGMAEYEIIKNLKLKITGGYQLVNYRNEQFNNSKTKTGFYHPQNTQYKGINGYLGESSTDRYLNENTLTYQFANIGHSLNVLGGLTMQKESVYTHDMESTFITNELFGMAGLGKTSSVPAISASKTENALLSYLGRINYNYKSKYYLTASFRADGSSKFAKGNRWGYFPSTSAAWTFSREEFLIDSKILSNGKVRVSYGRTGNNRVNDYAYRGKLFTDDNSFYPYNGGKFVYYIPESMQNENLKWETTEQFNAGIDLGLLKDRITMVFDYYIKTTKDLLLDADLAASSGYASTVMNIGELENKGLEITLETQNIRKTSFTWTTSFNASFNRNRITRLNDNQAAMTNPIYWDNKYRTMPAYISPVGSSAGMIYGYLYEGTYKNDDFIITDDGSGNLTYDPKPGVVLYSSQSRPGDPKYVDINKDGVINDKDKTIIGNGHPKMIGGLSNNFTFKGFDLSFFLQWSVGNDILNANRMIFENPSGKRHLNMFGSYTGRWTEENPLSDIPRAQATGSDQYCSLYVEDGSFLRLKTITLGYNIPTSLSKKYFISSVRVYVSADNIITLTNYSGNDPEVSTRHSVLTPGFDWSPYPRSRSYTFGLNVTF